MEGSRILFVVDLQRQFRDKCGRYEKCVDFVNAHAEDYDFVVETYFKNDPRKNPGFVKKLDWGGCSDVTSDDLEYKPSPSSLLIEKCGYGILESDLVALAEYPDCTIDVIGCDTDACVLAVCFNLWDAGFNFNVLWDYVYTTGEIDENSLRKLFTRNFGV